MRKKILTPLILLFSSICFGQAPPWIWATTSPGMDEQYSTSITSDQAGNIITTGYFRGNNFTIGTNSLPSQEVSDMFIAKYNPSGNLLWAKNIGGTSSNWYVDYDLGTDALGNIYVTGFFDVYALNVGSTVLYNSSQGYEIFIIKYDPNGNVIWAKTAIGNKDDFESDAFADAIGNFYICGRSRSDSLKFGNIKLKMGGVKANSFIAKYDAQGTPIWAKTLGGDSSAYSNCTTITTDTNGNVYVGGEFAGIGDFIIGNDTLKMNGGQNLFISKLDANGNHFWANQSTEYSKWQGYTTMFSSIIVSSTGDTYISGNYSCGYIRFDNDTLHNTDSTGTRDIFLVKYNASGKVIWAISKGGIGGGDELGNYSVLDKQGNIYVAGNWSSSKIIFGNTSLVNKDPGSYDLFVAKYDSSGNSDWAIGTGGVWNDSVTCITIDPSGQIYIAGGFSSQQLTFGTGYNFSTTGWNDFFIAKLGLVTGNSEITKKDVLNVFPNPFISQTSIKFETEQKNTTITLQDISGKIISSIQFSGKEFIMNNNGLPKGVYNLSFTDDKQNFMSQKVVVQ